MVLLDDNGRFSYTLELEGIIYSNKLIHGVEGSSNAWEALRTPN